MYPEIKLKPGKEANLIYRHPWVFSGALSRKPDNLANGSLVRVTDANGKTLGTGIFSQHSQISVRILDFAATEINQAWFEEKIAAAEQRRRVLGYGTGTLTIGYRVVFGEADSIPGLIVDRYNDVLVIQSSVAGIDRLKNEIVQALIRLFEPRAIIERSDLPVRNEEELDQVTGLLYGEIDAPVPFLENGLRFEADVIAGQKTGFYLDQKDLRREIVGMANGREVLNLFSNAGSFAVAALKGGAARVLNVDSSGPALDLCYHFAEINDLDKAKVEDSCSDVFAWLTERQPPSYDMIILDPPALIKSRQDAESGKKAYHFLNRAAMRMLRPGGILVTSSCSAFFTEEDFLFMLRRAAVQAERELHLLRYVPQSPDHPWSAFFPESKYLKSFLCLIP